MAPLEALATVGQGAPVDRGISTEAFLDQLRGLKSKTLLEAAAGAPVVLIWRAIAFCAVALSALPIEAALLHLSAYARSHVGGEFSLINQLGRVEKFRGVGSPAMPWSVRVRLSHAVVSCAVG